jgi:hypothetical protein
LCFYIFYTQFWKILSTQINDQNIAHCKEIMMQVKIRNFTIKKNHIENIVQVEGKVIFLL